MTMNEVKDAPASDADFCDTNLKASMIYEVTAAPPSWALGCQVRETLFFDTSVTMGLCGGPGSWKGSVA